MAITKISEWLNSERVFSEGVYLYKIYGKDPFLKAALNGRYSKTVHKQLVEALIELENKEAKQENIEPEKYCLPQDLQELQQQINNKYSELRLMHADLDRNVNQHARKEMAFAILEGFAWIDQSYDIINHYKATGRRLAKDEPESEQPWTLKRIIDGVKQIPPNLTKTRAKLLTEKKPEKLLVLNQRIAAWESEMEIIQSIIKENADVVFTPGK